MSEDTGGAAVPCPFCDRAEKTEPIAQFGGQIITSQWRCRACGSYFEVVRDELASPAPECATDALGEG